MPPCVLIRRNSRAHALWVQMSVRRYKHGHGDNIGNTRAHRELPSPGWTGQWCEDPGHAGGTLSLVTGPGTTTTTTRCAECVARASEAERGHRAETTTATTTTRCEVRCQPLKMRARPTGIGTVDPGLQWISAPEQEAAAAFLHPDLSCWYSRNWSLAWLVACSGLWLLLWCWHDFRNKRQIEMAILYCRESHLLLYCIKENCEKRLFQTPIKSELIINQSNKFTPVKKVYFLSCSIVLSLSPFAVAFITPVNWNSTIHKTELISLMKIKWKHTSSGVFSHPVFSVQSFPFITTEDYISDSASFSFPLGLILYFPFQSPAHGAKTSSRGI